MRRQATDLKKIVVKGISDEVLLSKIYKKHLKLNKEKMNNTIKKWAKDLNTHLTKGTDDTEAYERCRTSYVIKGNAN